MFFSSDMTQRDKLAWVGPSNGAFQALARMVTLFEDSDEFLLRADAFEFDVFIVCLTQQGVRGIDLIRLIRRRSSAGVVALCNHEHDDYVLALDFGADMVLDADAPPDHLLAAIAALRRRMCQGHASTHGLWTLLEDRSILQAPDGTLIPLSESDLVIMHCFVEAEGGRVERAVLIERLWGPGTQSMNNALHATLYRLRKRIEQSGQVLVPVHAVSRLGYEFRSPLVRG